jgi:hypothetical protein
MCISQYIGLRLGTGKGVRFRLFDDVIIAPIVLIPGFVELKNFYFDTQ